MNIKNFLSDAVAVRIALVLGKLLTRKAGYKLADSTGKWISNHQHYEMVRAVKANQWVVHDGKLNSDELNTLTVKVFQSAGRCLFDYFHFMDRSQSLLKIVSFGPAAQQAFMRIRNNQPTVIIVPHLSSFDLMGYALALENIPLQVLSFPNPNDAYKMQNKLRQRVGIEITPMSLSAFRNARKRLREGGSILSGLDRPLVGNQLEKYRPKFFGRETNLPVAYVRLAKEANAPIYMMACTTQPDGSYLLTGSEAIWVAPKRDISEEIVFNAERVLSKAADLIRQRPEQWAMFYPVWPEILDEIS
ncbi:MAG: lysophospholipid acyltransferase family protein [Chloroflexota bacterium]